MGQGSFYERVSFIKEKGMSWYSVDITPIDKIFGTATLKLKTSLSPLPRPDLILTVRRRDLALFYENTP